MVSPLPTRTTAVVPRTLGLVALSTAMAAAITGCSDSSSGSGAPGRSRPDVIVLVVDTLRADVAISPEQGRRNMPRLNALLDGALVFDNAWSTSSWTAPSTASLFTGLYPDQHRVITGLRAHGIELERDAQEGEDGSRDAHAELTGDALGPPQGPPRIPQQAETLATFLGGLGYRTLGVADNPNIGETLGFTRGFDEFVTMREGTADGVAEVVRGWHAELEDDAPVFLYVHFMDPHSPYQVRPEFYSDPAPNRRHEPYLEDFAAYKSEVRWMDERIGALFEELGGVEDALFFFAADHGEEFGDHGALGHRARLYAELMHVPLALRLPGPDAPRGRSREPVSLLDVLPTVRDYLGAPADPNSPGRSLIELTDGGTFEGRILFGMRTWDRGNMRRVAVVADGYSLIATLHTGTFELFNLKRDPRQLKDLSAEEPERTERMLALYERYRATAFQHDEERGPYREQTPEETALLEALGYAGEE